MKHQHSADVNVTVGIPTQDLETLIDKVTDSAITIVAVITVAHIVKSWFGR